MFVIDIDTCLDKRLSADPRFSPEGLAAECDRHQVACALAWSTRSVYYSTREGNDLALAAGRRHTAIEPVCVLDPREWRGWERELRRCLPLGFRALRFFPRLQNWDVSSAVFKDIMAAVAGTDAVLIFSLMEGNSAAWDAAERIARATAPSGRPVILTDNSYAQMSELAAVMRAHPHIHAETHLLTGMEGVALLAEQVGDERLIFGSGAPLHSMQKALNLVLESGLSAESKQRILGGNAIRLLGLPPERLAGRPVLQEFEPKGFAEEIIDVHSHLGHWWCPTPDEDYDPTQMLKRMKRYGISRSIVSSYEGMRQDIASGNARLANAIEGRPELCGYVELNPHQLELSCAEMDRYYRLPNFLGAEIELHHITGAPTDGPEMRALMAEVARRGKPVLLMPDFRATGGMEREIARRHPALSIIHAHGFDADWARAVADAPNVFVEFCTSAPSHRNLRDALDILGPERVLFGSDQTLLAVGGTLGAYLDAALTPAERRLVLHENARRIFRFP